MLHLPALRWGQPYKSLEVDRVLHFLTGEPVVEVSLASAGIIGRDMRHRDRAREVLRDLPPADLIARIERAADLFVNADLPLGDATQSPADFVRQQSATTGLPERLCRLNMDKLQFVLQNIGGILRALMRGLDLGILANGYGEEQGITRSYQAHSPVLGLVLPSNSPGVHSLWMPIIPLQVGLVLKPGPQEPWTPYRMAQAFFAAGIPKESISLYPGGADVGAAVLAHCPRNLIFGGTPTVERYKGNPAVQVHGPGFSKILLGEDVADRWEQFLDLMAESVAINSGRGCINTSSIWTPRHGRKIATALAERLASIRPLPPEDPQASLAAFTVPGQAAGISADIDAATSEPGVEDMSAAHQPNGRLISRERCDYLLPTVMFSESADAAMAKKEYMFPFAAVVECPQSEMLAKIGPTLVATGLTEDPAFRRALLDAGEIDRLNLGPVPTTRLNWYQPHEGNIVDFLYRARAFQLA